jgi:hypothetical protein
LGYFDIIKKGFRVANRNLMVLLTQFLAGLALLFVFAIFALIVVFMAVGSITALGLESFALENLQGIIETSFTLVAVGVFFVLIFIAIAALITAFVHSGNLGCVIETASGEKPGFTGATFWKTGHRSMMSMLGLYIVWGIITVGGFFVLAAVAGVGFEAILIPLKEAGKGLVAFGLGVPFIILLILAVVLFLFFLYAGWAFSGIILVGETRGVFSSFSRAYNFIRHNFWDSLLFALLMFALVFAANIVTNVIMLPFGINQDTKPAVALGFLPLMLLGVLLQMYVGLIARSSFVVFYQHRSTPPAARMPHLPMPPPYTPPGEKLPGEEPPAISSPPGEPQS